MVTDTASSAWPRRRAGGSIPAAQDDTDPGVLILSRFAGAAAEFKEGALLVNPYDPDSVAAAMARAIAMPLAERKTRHAALYATLLTNDISKWGDRFLSTLMGTKTFDLAAADKQTQWQDPGNFLPH